MASSASSFTYDTSSFQGLMSDARIKTAEDTANWPTGKSGIVPSRLEGDGSTILQLSMNRGTGWLLGSVADIRCQEFLVLKEGVVSKRDSLYTHLAWRDSLLITNGEDSPQQVSFNKRFNKTQFYLDRLGMEAPSPSKVTITATLGGAGSDIVAGDFSVLMSFLAWSPSLCSRWRWRRPRRSSRSGGAAPCSSRGWAPAGRTRPRCARG